MEKKSDIGALILRVVLGLIFLAHGLVKFQDGLAHTATSFSEIGVPGWMAYAVAWLELVGGIALILGLGTRIFALLIALFMLGAIVKVKLAAGFVSGYELDLALLAIAIHLVLYGQHRYAIDRLITRGDYRKIK